MQEARVEEGDDLIGSSCDVSGFQFQTIQNCGEQVVTEETDGMHLKQR